MIMKADQAKSGRWPKDNRIIKIAVLLIVLVFNQMSLGQTLRPTDQEIGEILKIVNYAFDDSFYQAFTAVAVLNDTIPGKPIYHLLYASIIHARMMDGEDFSQENEFMSNIDFSIKALNNWNDNHPKDAWGYFLLGSAYGYKTIWQGQKGSWFKSMLTGLKAKGNFFEALKIDPGLYDCYTGIGSYHYWASIKLRKIFPFLSDNRQDGLNELRLAMDSSFISQKAASVGYAWALLNEKKYSEALKVANHLKEETNSGRNSLWLLSAIYWGNGNLKKAAEYYKVLIESLDKAGNQNYFNLIFCRYRLGICYYGLQDFKSAKTEFETLLSYNPSAEIRDRHKKTFNKARDYLAKINGRQIEETNR
jgi:tetratricopeptide (TPR) repeat protein